MRVYYDTTNGSVNFAFSGDYSIAPAGDFIEVPDGTDVYPLDAYSVVGNQLVEVSVLPHIKQAINKVNNQIGEIRSQFITVLPGQGMIYAEKEKEAIAIIAEGQEPTDLDPYPFLRKEIGVTGQTLTQVAQVILNLAVQWRVVRSNLEELRLGTIAQLENVTTKAEIDPILLTFETILEQL